MPCFASLSDDAINVMIDNMNYETHTKGEVICEEGDVADAAFVVCDGQCAASVSLPHSAGVQKVGIIGSGEIFGSRALEFDAESSSAPVRNASVTVESDVCNLLVLSRAKFFKLLNKGSVLDEAVKISLEEIEGARAKHNQELLHRIDIESGHTQPPLSSNTEVKSVKSHGDAESSINRSGELSSEESPSIGERAVASATIKRNES